MAFQEISLLVLFPVVFLIGRAISKSSKEEINQVRPVTILINKIIILTACFLTLNYFVSIFTTIVVCLMIFTYFMLNEQSTKEKILIAITSSLAIVNMFELVVLLGLLALFLKGVTLYEEGEKVITKISLLQASLFFYTISFKFFALSILKMMGFF